MTGCLSDLHEAMHPAIKASLNTVFCSGLPLQGITWPTRRWTSLPLHPNCRTLCSFLPTSLYLILAREVTVDTDSSGKAEVTPYYVPERPFLSDCSLKRAFFELGQLSYYSIVNPPSNHSDSKSTWRVPTSAPPTVTCSPVDPCSPVGHHHGPLIEAAVGCHWNPPRCLSAT